MKAKKMARYGPCKECGKPANGPGEQLCLHHSLKLFRKQEYEDRQFEARRKRYMEDFQELPEDTKLQHILAALRFLTEHMEGKPTVEVSPEEVPAANQDAVDAAFFDIMADVAI